MGWLAGYALRRKFSTQHANIDGALTDFPLLVALDSYAPLAAALATGYDLRVTQSDGETLQKYEREQWSGGAGSAATLRLWTKCPSLSAVAATEQYLYWGKAGDSDGEDAENVYDSDTEAAYTCVDDPDTSTLQDSTSNGNDGTKGAAGEPTETTGSVHYGQNFDGDDYVDLGTLGTFGTRMDTEGFSFSCRLKTSDTSAARMGCANSSSQTIMFVALNANAGLGASSGRLAMYARDNDGNRCYGGANADTGFNDGSWHTITWEMQPDADTITIYVDGQAQAITYTQQATPDNTGNLQYGFCLGCYNTSSGQSLYYTGDLDVVRLASAVRGAAWAKFFHHNLAEADNELTWGDLEFNPAFAAAAALPRFPVQIHRPRPLVIPY